MECTILFLKCLLLTLYYLSISVILYLQNILSYIRTWLCDIITSHRFVLQFVVPLWLTVWLARLPVCIPQFILRMFQLWQHWLFYWWLRCQMICLSAIPGLYCQITYFILLINEHMLKTIRQISEQLHLEDILKWKLFLIYLLKHNIIFFFFFNIMQYSFK